MTRLRIEEIVGHRMRDARKRRGISQQELGGQVGTLLGREWSRQAVSAAEAGQRAFTAAELVTVSIVLGVSITEMFAPPIGIAAVIMPAGSEVRRSELIPLQAGQPSGDRTTGAAIGRIGAILTRVAADVESLQTEVQLLADQAIGVQQGEG